MMKNQIVRSQIIWDYTYVDELLDSAICHYFFGKKRGFIKLWKTKKFKNFNRYILEVLSLTEKLRLVKAIHEVPKSVAADIEALNALRNGLAHAFFPENLRSSKPNIQGQRHLRSRRPRAVYLGYGQGFQLLSQAEFWDTRIAGESMAARRLRHCKG